MPAVSKQQQKLFGLALAFKRGEIEASEVSDEVKDIADRMSEKDIEDYASTKHKELPKMKEQLRKIVREIMRERAISELTEENPCWKGYKQIGMKTKDGKKVPNCVKESINENRNIGHYERVGNQTIVDSNFVNLSKGVIPNSKLVHLGMGDFSLKTPKGDITFKRSGKLQGIGEDFVGRPHRVVDNKGGKLIDELITSMVKKKKAILSMSESVNEARKVSKPIKVDDDTMVQIVGDNKGFRELTATLNPKTGKPIQKFGFDRGNEIANSKEELIKKLQKKYGKSIKFESVINEGYPKVVDERPFGKRGIIIMVNDYGKMKSVIFKDRKNLDKLKLTLNFPGQVQKLLDLAKDTKWPNAIDESVNEVSRRATDFFSDSKHGKTLHSLLNGKWNPKKVEKYLDKVGNGDDVKNARIIDFISTNVGLDTRKYKTLGEQIPELINKLKELYSDFQTK